MKKGFIITFSMVLLSVSLFSGCGKSEEEKARDEIMSHMSDDEKAAIAEDQKAMKEYEAEREKKAEEEPVDYSENLVEKSLLEIVNTLHPDFISNNVVSIPDINILLPDDQYIYNIYTEGGSRIVYGSEDDFFEVSVKTNSANAISVTTDTADCGDYQLDVYIGDISGAFTFTEKGADEEFVISIGYPAIVEKNFDFIKSQLGK